MSTQTLSLTPALYQYLLNVSLRESEILKSLRQETAKLVGAQMQIAPEQGQFMALLVEILGAQKTIELGVFTGYSALVVAQSLPEHGKVIACDINDENAAIARQYWHKAGVEQKIELRIAPALETLEILLNQGQANTFDFAFIDADKGNYPVYYEKVLQLIRPGGLIAIDNMLWGGKVADPSVQDESTQVIRALNQQIQQDDRVTLSLVPIGDGLLLARKRI